MTVERFTREQFEAALPVHKDTGNPLWKYGGLDTEHWYIVPVDGTNKRIVIRSSIDQSGIAAESGADSIRLWVEYYYEKVDKWLALGKLDTWTTRAPGWEKRMIGKLRKLWELALEDSRRYNNKSKAYKADELSGKEKTDEKKIDADIDSSALREAGGDPPHPPGTGKEAVPPASPFDLGQSHKVEIEDSSNEIEAVEGPTPNEQQRSFIEAPTDAAIRVLAGPGSGKTFCVARRYAYLLSNGAHPQDIIAVTFNRSMAEELLSRIARVNPQIVGTAADKQVCTIHALCNRMLKEEGDRRRVPKIWQIKKTLQEIIDDVWGSGDKPGYKEVLAFIDTAKAKGLTSADDMQFFGKIRDRYGRNVGRELHEARRRFDEKMRRSGWLTFADMPFDVEVKLKTDSQFRQKFQQRYKFIIVDEGQDTTAQAMRILTTLAEPQDQFCIVGDTDQLLYRFAGATPEANLYGGFEERYPDGLMFKLEVNYRSTWTIVDAQLELIQRNYEEFGGPYNQKYLKTLVPCGDANDGEPITFQEYPNPELEARSVVESILESIQNGRKPGDIFIGARTRAQLGYLEGPLTRAKLPFINITGGSFWASKHVADVIAYLRLAYNEHDDEAFKRVFNIGSNWSTYPWGDKVGDYCPHRFLGRAFLDACNESYTNVWTAYNRRRSFQPGIEDLTEFVQELQAEMAAGNTPAQAIEFIIDNCYERYLMTEEGITSTDEAENGKLEDLNTVLDIAGKFETVEEFLDYVNDAVKAAESADDKNWDGYIVISTVHRLKGLERPIVYGVGISEGVSSDRQSPAGLLPHTFSMTPPPQNGILPAGGMGRIEDERCIAFVLVSRAKEEVHLSGVKQYRKSDLGPSRFIVELGLRKEAKSLESY